MPTHDDGRRAQTNLQILAVLKIERTNSRRSTFEKTGLTPPVPLLLLAQTKELDPLQGFHLGRAASSKPTRGSALHGLKFNG